MEEEEEVSVIIWNGLVFETRLVMWMCRKFGRITNGVIGTCSEIDIFRETNIHWCGFCVLQKLFYLVDILGLRVNKATCYEMMHTWNPDCYGAIVDSLWDGWLFSLKTYIILYGVG
ncbi:unnamed protein product [Onchocerca flexuosa]|uniref:Transmembrane protein n=1 Tax=Onchocerca flexuosa TaxID=387005 RepID=A0A183H2U1_9BILA|nr:unnamed protein product [Onchocerca flexuosa]